MPIVRPVHAATVVLGSLVMLLGACGSSSGGANGKTRNAALDVALVNGEFAAGNGGWSGTGFTLDRGCATNAPDANLPSLGAWTKNALTFSTRGASVTQQVTIPQPAVVEFSVTAVIPADDPKSVLSVGLTTFAESQNSGPRFGVEATKPTQIKLSLATTEPNEVVTIALRGVASKSRRGCFGPSFSNASLKVSYTPAPTTTQLPTTTSSTTTPATSTTTTTIPKTTTTTPRTTTIAANTPKCRLKWNGKIFTACKAMKMVFGYFDGYNVTTDSRFQAQFALASREYTILNRYSGARLVINILFEDGTSIANAAISYFTDEYADKMNYPRSVVDVPFATSSPKPYFG